MNAQEEAQKKIASIFQKNWGVPINHRRIIRSSGSGAENIDIAGNHIAVNLGTGPLKLSPRFIDFMVHLKKLHKITGQDHPNVLHSAALVAMGNREHNPNYIPDYNSLLKKQIGLQKAKHDEVAKHYRNLTGKSISTNLEKQKPGQLKQFASLLKPHGITNISYLHKDNFDNHLKDNNLDPSQLRETASHKGYLHNGTLYLTRKTPPLPGKNNSVDTLNSALQMFKKKVTPPPLPTKKTVKPPPLPPPLPPQRPKGTPAPPRP